MGPCVLAVEMAKCAVGILMCEGPENILLVVIHVLCVSRF